MDDCLQRLNRLRIVGAAARDLSLALSQCQPGRQSRLGQVANESYQKQLDALTDPNNFETLMDDFEELIESLEDSRRELVKSREPARSSETQALLLIHAFTHLMRGLGARGVLGVFGAVVAVDPIEARSFGFADYAAGGTISIAAGFSGLPIVLTLTGPTGLSMSGSTMLLFKLGSISTSTRIWMPPGLVTAAKQISWGQLAVLLLIIAHHAGLSSIVNNRGRKLKITGAPDSALIPKLCARYEEHRRLIAQTWGEQGISLPIEDAT